MSRKLTANVVVRHPESGVPEVLREGSDLPDWAKELVGDHVLDGDSPSSDEEGDEEPDASDKGSVGSPPPQQGHGSSKTAWSEYAKANGVKVESGASRDDIIDAVREAGVRVE